MGGFGHRSQLTDAQRDLVTRWYPYVLIKAFEHGKGRGCIVADEILDNMTDALINAARIYNPDLDKSVSWFKYMSFCLKNAVRHGSRRRIHYEHINRLDLFAVTHGDQFEVDINDTIEQVVCESRTSRQHQIQLFCEGMSDNDVAQKLGITRQAASKTRCNLMRRLKDESAR